MRQALQSVRCAVYIKDVPVTAHHEINHKRCALCKLYIVYKWKVVFRLKVSC